MAKVQVTNVSYRYPLEQSWALNQVSLEAAAGEIIGIIGNNGHGKTTLCNVLRRFAPDFYKGELTGEILIDNKQLQDFSREELSKTIGFVSQNPFVQITGATETVFEELAFGLENLGLPLEQITVTVERIIEQFELGQIAEKNPLHLSGGQKQKVALASVIAMDPEVYIIDEPTSQLDPLASKEIIKMIQGLKQKNKCVFLVEHKMELLAEFADRLYVLDSGQIYTSGTPVEVFNQIIRSSLAVDCPQPLHLLKDLVDHAIIPDAPQLPVTRSGALAYLRKEVEINDHSKRP